MAKTKAQIQFEADTQGFNDGIKAADKELVTLRKELKLNGTELKENADNTDLLTQRKNILQKEAEQVSQKVNLLSSSLESAKRLFGDNSKEVYQLNNKLLDAKNQYQGIQNEIIQTDNKVKLLDKSSDQLSDSLDNVNKSAKSTNDGFTIMKGAMADLVSSGIQSVIGGAKELVDSLFSLSEETEEYRVMQSKLEGSANSFGYSMDFANSKYEQFYSYVGDDQMATNAITNLMGLGLETQNLDGLVNGAIATWSAYGDSIPIESLTESITESINVGQVTGTLADTINWASLSNEKWTSVLGEGSKAQKAFNKALKDGEPAEDAFSKALASTTSESERANMIAGLLNQTYGESKETYDKLAGSTIEANKAELELKDTQGKLGEVMQPVNSIFTEFKTKALEAILPVVTDVANGFQDLVKWLKENPTAMTVLSAIVVGLATSFTILAGALAIQGLINGVTKAFALLNGTLLANPIVLIITIIAGLVAAFVTLWTKCEGFRNFFQGLWEGIKNVVSVVVEWIKNNWQSLILFLINPIAGLFKYFYDNFEGFRNTVNNVIEAVKGFFQGLWDKVKGVWDNIVLGAQVAWALVKIYIIEPISNAKDKVIETVNNIKDKVVNIFETVKNKVKSVWNAIKSAIETPINKAKDIVKSAIDKIKGFFSFEFKWPKLKLPHFSIKPKGWEIGDLLKGKIPKLGIDWYAKGAIFTKPTVLATNNGLKGVAEAGAETILPISKLENWINSALTSSSLYTIQANNENFSRIEEKLDQIISKKISLYLDSEKMAEASYAANDNISGLKYAFKERGLEL